MVQAIRFQQHGAAREAYRPDAAKIVSGDPLQSVANLFASADGRFNCGEWTGAVGCWRVQFTENEFCHLLEGVVIVTDESGHAQRFQAGDAFVMPAGFVGTWETVEPARKFYAVYE